MPQLQMLLARDLRLVGDEAVVPPELEVLDKLTSAAWGQPLPLPQYLKRERRMRAAPFSRGLRTWVLRDGANALASCESYEVPLAVRDPRKKNVHKGLVHGIASVFVDE